MRNLLFIISIVFSTMVAFAQAPTLFNYQAVARDGNDQAYQNTNLGIRISLVKGGSSGIISYSERHLVTTSRLGVFNIQIGAGTILAGNLSLVDWSNDVYYIKVDMDPDGGTDYINMGINQLLSVPYALYAEKSGDGGGNDADTDPTNEIQTISLNGTQIVLSNGGGVINLPTGTIDTDDQTLMLNGTNLSIADGNTVDLSNLPDEVNDADNDPSNELQMLAFDPNNNTLSLSDGNTITIPSGGTDADADPNNEIQTISLNGNQITLSNGGGTIDLPSGTIDTDDQTLILNGTNLTIADGNTVDLSILQDGVDDADNNPNNELQTLSFDITNNMLSLTNGNSVTIPTGGTDADADPNNEIQTISLNGNQIALSNGGGTIDLPSGTIDTDDQTLMLNGTNLTISDGNTVDLANLQDGVDDADNNPNNELQTLSKSGNIVTLSNGGGSFTDAINDADADPINEIQTISLNGTQILLSNGGGTINLPAGTIDTDDQTLILNGTNLTIADGNTVDLANLQDGVDDADNNPSNELQTLSKSGNTVTLSITGSSFTDAIDDADADPQNEIQSLELTDNQLSISGGNSIDLETVASPWTEVGTAVTYEGLAHANTITTNSVDIFGLDEFSRMTAGGVIVDNGFANTSTNLTSSSLLLENSPANTSAILSSDELEMMDGLSVSKLEPAHLHMTGSETMNLTDDLLQIENTSGTEVNLRASGVSSYNQFSATSFGMSSLSGFTLSGSNQVVSWGFEKMGYSNLGTGAKADLYPSNLFFYNYLDDNAPNSSIGPTLFALDQGLKNAYLTIDEIALKSSPINYKVKITAQDKGEIKIYNTDSNESVSMTSTNLKTGQISLKDTGGNTSILLSHLNGASSYGYLAIKADNDEKAVLYATSDKAGLLRLRGPNETTNVLLSSSSFNNNGTLSLFDDLDRRLVYFNASRAAAGFMDITATNIGGGNRNASLSWLSGYVGHGYITVNDWQGDIQAGLYVNSAGDGIVFADVKNFRMDHPTEEDKEIWYASLEGPEAGAYERGTASIENGEAFVQFSEHFQLVGNHETMTVSLTPLSAETYGLAVIEKKENGFQVKELAGGNGHFSFDWEVKCVRKGYEDYRVIRDKDEERPAEPKG